jgi:Fe-S cluster assembly protein SufD
VSLERYKPPAGPGWWDREGALARFLEKGFPTRKVEAFKYTDVRFLEKAPLQLAPARVELDRAEAWSKLEESDGDRFDSSAEPVEAPFRALNTAMAEGGLFLRVPAGEDLGELKLKWDLAEGEESHARIMIVVEANAKLRLFERYEGEGGPPVPGFLNLVTEVFLAEGAELVMHAVQDAPAGSTVVRRVEVSQSGGSRFVHGHVDAGGGVVRHDINARLNEPFARTEIKGAYLVSTGQHADVHARVDHVAPDCESEMWFAGVLGGKGRAVFDGVAFVHKDAQRTLAEQQNRNLLLSEDAEIDTKPQLEIFADDVKCAHGATVGQLDEDALFYLRSRGLSDHDAKAILTRGFVAEAIADFPDDVREEALAHVDRHLKDLLEGADGDG